MPLGLATGTTAVGLLSLLYSDLAPIRLFGVFSAVGVAIGLAMQFVLLPALLVVWPANADAKLQHPRRPDDAMNATAPSRSRPFWQRLARRVIRRQAWISAALPAAPGRRRRGPDADGDVDPDHAALRPEHADHRQLCLAGRESRRARADGSRPPLRRTDQAAAWPQRLKLVSEVQDAIAELPDVGGSLSAATFAPSICGQSGALAAGLLDQSAALEGPPQLIESGYLAERDDEELWRISVRVKRSSDLDYGVFQHELQGKVAADPGRRRSRTAGEVDGRLYRRGADHLQGPPLAARWADARLRHRRGPDRHRDDRADCGTGRNGLLLFLASVFPMTIVFGMMGWLGIVVDIGSVMTPCVALGVTVDDVIHFVLWYPPRHRARTERAARP